MGSESGIAVGPPVTMGLLLDCLKRHKRFQPGIEIVSRRIPHTYRLIRPVNFELARFVHTVEFNVLSINKIIRCRFALN